MATWLPLLLRSLQWLLELTVAWAKEGRRFQPSLRVVGSWKRPLTRDKHPEQHQSVCPRSTLGGSVVHGQEEWSGCAWQDGFQVLFVWTSLLGTSFFNVCKTRLIKRDEVYKACSQVPGIEQIAFAWWKDLFESLIQKVIYVSLCICLTPTFLHYWLQETLNISEKSIP